MKTLKQHTLLLITAAVILLIVLYLANHHQMTSPITWSEITPGTTTQAEVLKILGQPDKTEIRKGYPVFTYNKTENLGWSRVEVWFLTEANNPIVGGITLYFPDNNSVEIVQGYFCRI